MTLMSVLDDDYEWLRWILHSAYNEETGEHSGFLRLRRRHPPSPDCGVHYRATLLFDNYGQIITDGRTGETRSLAFGDAIGLVKESFVRVDTPSGTGLKLHTVKQLEREPDEVD